MGSQFSSTIVISFHASSVNDTGFHSSSTKSIGSQLSSTIVIESQFSSTIVIEFVSSFAQAHSSNSQSPQSHVIIHSSV